MAEGERWGRAGGGGRASKDGCTKYKSSPTHCSGERCCCCCVFLPSNRVAQSDVTSGGGWKERRGEGIAAGVHSLRRVSPPPHQSPSIRAVKHDGNEQDRCEANERHDGGSEAAQPLIALHCSSRLSCRCCSSLLPFEWRRRQGGNEPLVPAQCATAMCAHMNVCT